MDFSKISLGRVAWSSGTAKGGSTTYKALYGAGKIMFQIPRCRARIAPVPRFPGAVELGLEVATLPHEFREFVAALESLAAEHIGAEGSPYSALGRMTAFNDALIFQDGVAYPLDDMHTRAPAHYQVAVLAQLDGAWVSQRSWGLRFKVAQVKVYGEGQADLPSPPPVSSTVHDRKRKAEFLEDD